MKAEVFILTPEPPSRPGGMERFVSNVAEVFKKHGYEVSIFHGGNCVPRRLWVTKTTKKWVQIVAEALNGYFIGRVARMSLRPSVRLVLSNSSVGWFPAGKEVKQAHFYHGTWCGQADAIRPFIRYRGYLKLKWWNSMVLERLSGRGKILLCASDLVRDHLRRYFGYEAHTVWYPMDLDHFRLLDRKTCRQRLGISETAPVGLFVGSSLPTKGFATVEHLVRAFPKVQWLLALLGEFPERIQYLSNVLVFQNAPYELLPTLYNAADFSLSPSRYDSFPYVVAEALACGTPVIASPHGGSLTFHKNTLLEPLLTTSTDGYAGFERAVKLVLEDPAEWRAGVQKEVRPLVEKLMAPDNWWQRFTELTGL